MCSRVWLMNTKRLCILSLNFIDALQSKSNPSKTYVYICIYIYEKIYIMIKEKIKLDFFLTSVIMNCCVIQPSQQLFCI